MLYFFIGPVILVSVTAAIVILSLLVAFVVQKRKHSGDNLVNKEVKSNVDLKQHLSHTKSLSPHAGSLAFSSFTFPHYTCRIHKGEEIYKGSVPEDHLARLDEFSMITAILGPRG